MALIHNYQVEEVGGVLFVKAGAFFVLGDSLICGEVDWAALRGVALFDHLTGVAEDGKNPILRVVHEKVAVGEV